MKEFQNIPIQKMPGEGEQQEKVSTGVEGGASEAEKKEYNYMPGRKYEIAVPPEEEEKEKEKEK